MKNKKPLLAIIALIGVAAVIGGVLSFYSESRKFDNDLKLGAVEIEAVENFVSPDNWVSCQEASKSVLIKNSGSVAATARISYTEYWKALDNSDLPLQKDGRNVAQISFANPNDWELRNDGWYYYKNVLEPDDVTSEFIDGVMLDCQMNLGGNNVCTTLNGETVCETPDNTYASAKYHLDLKLQLISAQSTAVAFHHEYNCDENLLFNKIECSSPRLDYSENYWNQNPSYNGIFVNGAHRYDEFPIYYYRGNVTDNNVLWANYCWQILHTTSTGGIKMVYNGEPVDGKCEATMLEDRIITYNGEIYYPYNATSGDFTDIGYMKGGTGVEVGTFVKNKTDEDEFSHAKKVSYDANTNSYTLVDPITGPWSESYYRILAADKGFDYFCIDGSSSCEKVAYLISRSTSGANITTKYLLFSNGLTRNRGFNEVLDVKKTPSVAKTVVEGWFKEHLDLYEGDLEDAVFCSETVVPVTLADGFGSHYRRSHSGDAGRPTFDCKRKEDRYTKYDVSGNRKLKHRVGLMTSDEVRFSGMWSNADCDQMFICARSQYSTQYSSFTWTMSPAMYGSEYSDSNDMGAKVMALTTSLNAQIVTKDKGVYRPVVSLRADTRYDTTTDGTATNPYKIVKE